MANSGPNTNGSQYYITVDEASWLDGDYTIFGRIVDGMDVVYAISEVETDAYDKPLVDVDIYSITISDYNPQLALTYPDGGKDFLEDSIITIQWNSEYVADVKIEYSTDNGTNWNTINDSIPADFSQYEWQVPADYSELCLIKLSDVQHPETIDESDANFEIRIKPVKITRFELYEGVTPNIENEDNLIMPEKPLRFKIQFSSNYDVPLTNLTASINTANSGVSVTQNQVSLLQLNDGEKVWSDDYFEVIMPETVPVNESIVFTVSVTSDDVPDIPCKSSFSIPMLKLGNFSQAYDNNTGNSAGNGNGIAEPGETIELKMNLANTSKDTCYQVYGKLTKYHNFINIWNGIEGVSGTVYDTTMYNNFQPINPNNIMAAPKSNFVFDYNAADIYFVPLLLKVYGFINGEQGSSFEEGGIKMGWGIPYSMNDSYPVYNDETTQSEVNIVILGNPCNDKIRFLYNNYDSEGEFILNIYVLSGKKMFSENYIHNNENIYQIECSEFSNALYFLVIIDGNNVYRNKVVINR